MEDYLKTIYHLTRGGDRVSTSQLAQRMDCSAASVTNMLQKLSDLKLVQYKPYQGVTMTPSGSRVALEILRHHRLVELYLQQELGYSWDKVHAEAEELEHVISEELEERIDRALGRPTKDPHGHPIPSKDGRISSAPRCSLWEVPSGGRVRVSLVSDRNPEVLRHLASMGIYPEVGLSIQGKAPFNGPLSVRVDGVEGKECSLTEELARQIYVIPI